MNKHTPGPWTDNVTVPLKAIDCERIGFSIGFVNGHREGEALANASLIAAAPDLLRALKCCFDLGIDKAIVPMVKAAIAKAEGQS